MRDTTRNRNHDCHRGNWLRYAQRERERVGEREGGERGRGGGGAREREKEICVER